MTTKFKHAQILADYLAANPGASVTSDGVKAHVEHGGCLVTKVKAFPDRLDCPTCGAACHSLTEHHGGSLRCRRCARPSLWQSDRLDGEESDYAAT